MNAPSLEDHRLFFQHSFDLLAVVGVDGYFKQVNPAFERLMGYTPDEMYARPVIEFLHPDDVLKTKKGIQTLAGGTPTISSINRYRCKDGRYKWFSWNTMPIDGRLYSVGRDITQQVEAEEQIRRLNVELSQKNENLEIKVQERAQELQKSEAQVLQLQKMDAIGRLAGGIAHDFNNILGAISMYSDLLAEEAGNPEAVRQKVKDLLSVTDRASSLTRQLLIFSRQQIVKLQPIKLNPLIHQLEKLLLRLIGENIKITSKLSENLNSINADASQIEQVILNLVVNARDAMPAGGTVTIETSNVFLDESFTSTHLRVEPGQYVLLSVADTGTGMDSATLSKIFEPFFTTKDVGKGTGMGLSTTYGIVKQCKGTIWVYSEVGKGTIFKIYLPVAENAPDAVVIPPVVVSEIRGTQTILLVEDDQMLRQGFVAMLEKRGYKVLVATHGLEALELIDRESETIHLLLTDIVMPGMNGLELAKKVTAKRPKTRVLYMSGYTSDVIANESLKDIDQMAFIQKPFSTNALITKVQEILKGS